MARLWALRRSDLARQLGATTRKTTARDLFSEEEITTKRLALQAKLDLEYHVAYARVTAAQPLGAIAQPTV